MECEALTLRTRDGLDLYAREWRDSEAEANAVVCLVHGMGEHSGRYAELALRLTGAGYAVLAYDQRGHGRSPGTRGHTPSMEALRADAAALIELARRRRPELPRVLYGHSMGGNVALSCALHLQPRLHALVLTSPWLRLAFEPPRLKLLVGRGMARIWPAFSQSTGLQASDLVHELPDLPPKSADPLVHDRITAGMYFALMREGLWAISHADRLQVPLLLLHGLADPVTSERASAELAAALGERCTYAAWPDGLHELHQDKDKAQVMDMIVDWLDAATRRSGDGPA
ncbi:alpha/beta hydrolase [Paenibacillus sabuli]|nr:alpha/beta hydrolase [Paenibacillus sabuli]